MGLFDFLSWNSVCPQCGDRGARQGLFGGVRCPNRACPNFDMGVLMQREEVEQQVRRSVEAELRRQHPNPQISEVVAKPVRMEFDPGQFRIEVRYQNFRGEEKVFVGDRRTLRRRGNHLSLCLAPTGQRIAFSRDRIRNVSELDAIASRLPNSREQRVLRFHMKRGTTSPLCERLRTKYPDW